MENTSLILIGLFMIMVIAVVLMIVIIIKLSGRDDRNSILNLRREMRDEISKSRQETLDSVQSSVKNLGDMIYKNQKQNTDMQSIRLMELNKQLNYTLQQVTKSLSEMQSLSAGVGDLQKILSNVKTRGIVGEIQLGAILQDILSPDQYVENAAVKGGSERVEFAVKFPGENGNCVYLPIDSKFPADAYIKLLDAYDIGDKALIKATSDNLKHAIIKAAKDIKTKYVQPPETTEFAIMFLPFEGLYAEVLRLGMVETLQNEYRINIAGPTTMAAMLNSFQMGFKSLALQQRSGEVWDTLEKVRTEFDKFAEVLAKTQMRMDQTQKELETLIGARTRSIQKALKNVSELKESEME